MSIYSGVCVCNGMNRVFLEEKNNTFFCLCVYKKLSLSDYSGRLIFSSFVFALVVNYCKNAIRTPAATADPITPEMFDDMQ